MYKVVAIRRGNREGDELYILDSKDELTRAELIALVKSGLVEHVSIVRASTGEYVRSDPNSTLRDNLSNLTISCNERDFLFFDFHWLILKTANGREKLRWKATSGSSDSTRRDQSRSDFGPIPEGTYVVRFSRTLDIANATSLWDQLKWHIKSPDWGYIATPLEADSETNTFGREGFYIHGGWSAGSAGCIDLTDENERFHTMLRLYKRDFRLVVQYDAD